MFFGVHGFDSLSNLLLLSVWKRFFAVEARGLEVGAE